MPTGNRLPFILAAVNRVINETVDYDKILLITVLHCKFILSVLFVKRVISTKM